VEIAPVLVVGGGPAGASAASELERLGVGHILLDRAGFPRDKPCAGILPPTVSDLTGPVPAAVRERSIRGYFLHTVSGRTFRSRFSRPGCSVDRSRFDAWLVSRLRTPPRRGVFVGAAEEAGLVVAQTDGPDVGCRVLIGADGAVSRAGAAARIRPGKLAFACQASVPMGRAEISRRTGDWFHVFYVIPAGYGWVAPHAGELRVGVGSLRRDRAGREALGRFLASARVGELTGGRPGADFRSHRIPMSGPPERTGRGRILLAGDAGGFVFPGTGEGIRFAIASGRCAAEAAAAAVKDGWEGPDLQAEYTRLLTAGGLLSLREVDFQSVLDTPESAERYVRRLTSLSRRASSSSPRRRPPCS